MIEEIGQNLRECNEHLNAATEPLYEAADRYDQAAEALKEISQKMGEVASLWLQVRQNIIDTKGPVAVGEEKVRQARQCLEGVGILDLNDSDAQTVMERFIVYHGDLAAFSERIDEISRTMNTPAELSKSVRYMAETFAPKIRGLWEIGRNHDDFTNKTRRQTTHIMKNLGISDQ